MHSEPPRAIFAYHVSDVILLLPFWTTWIQHGRDLKPRVLGNLNMLFNTSTVRILFRFNKNKRNCIDINVVFKWNPSISRGTEIYFFMTSLPASKMYSFWYISFHLLHPRHDWVSRNCARMFRMNRALRWRVIWTFWGIRNFPGWLYECLYSM